MNNICYPALLIDAQNSKVRLRRAKVNEKIGKFTSLSESLEGKVLGRLSVVYPIH